MPADDVAVDVGGVDGVGEEQRQNEEEGGEQQLGQREPFLPLPYLGKRGGVQGKQPADQQTIEQALQQRGGKCAHIGQGQTAVMGQQRHPQTKRQIAGKAKGNQTPQGESAADRG